ncbi:MAG: DUF2309 domain-containing protein [Deltaproteobacteria bacterium]|nr:DUF2309 domain-containing protein [Deltaproteobacteria bacterium]
MSHTSAARTGHLGSEERDEAWLEETLDHIAHLLPDQRPLEVFVHHNTLHGFEDRDFHLALRDAARIYGATTYQSEREFHAALTSGRIRRGDLEAAVDAYLEATGLGGKRRIAELISWRDLLLIELDFHAKKIAVASLPWAVSEGVLPRPRTDHMLWEACIQLARAIEEPPGEPARDEPNDHPLMQSLLIRLCAAYLDRGMAAWQMPKRELGFFGAATELLRHRSIFASVALKRAAELFERVAVERRSASQTVLFALDSLRVARAEASHVLERQCLQLAGWAGMFNRLEKNPTELPPELPSARLVDYLAVRLLLALAYSDDDIAAATLDAPRGDEVPTTSEGIMLQRALRLLFVLQHAGVSSGAAATLSRERCFELLAAVTRIDAFARAEIWQEAYERRYRDTIASALAQHRPQPVVETPVVQVITCIDDREESFRRHLEETDARVETFGAAGFFGVAMSYRGLDDGGFAPLCPVVLAPAHRVEERPIEAHGFAAIRARWRRRFAHLEKHSSASSRSLVRGSFFTFLLGIATAFPLLARILSPRLSHRVSLQLRRLFFQPPQTKLTVARDEHPESDQTLGFSVAEMTERVYVVLAGAGLKDRFAPLVILLGHGSTSANNPHRSAYECGACGGRRGGPNARSFAAMANDPKVRQELTGRGVRIPDATWFIGGEHDTTNEEIELFDLELVPPSHRAALAEAARLFDEARAKNAHERIRRFPFGSRRRTLAQALAHVEARSVNLAEARPEYNHATNASCIIGRRSRTRGLFLDRRSFLVSYDATIDPDAEHLTRQLGAVLPVVVGINLEYYFSTVDNERFGCGTKLPHNLTGLFAVMNGHGSDLRTGLWRQTVEIHEPMRLLVVVEASAAQLERAFSQLPLARGWLERAWFFLLRLDPQGGQIDRYDGKTLRPYDVRREPLAVVATSLDACCGERDFVTPKVIEAKR